MSIEQDRLLSLIEFAQQSARLRTKPATAVTQHGIFSLWEHQLQGLPGITLNSGNNGEDEIWLSVERRHETRPPAVQSAILSPWVNVTQSPSEDPKLKSTTDGASLIGAGTHRSSLKSDPTKEEQGLPAIDPRRALALEDYERNAEVRAHFKAYVESNWRLWAESEKLNRRTIRLYSQLFTLKQQVEGGIVDAQMELAWGVGIGIWKGDATTVTYPLVTRLVELSLNPETASIEIKPRDVEPRLEVDWYAAVDNPGLAALERSAREFFGSAATTFSPFDRMTFEGLLRSAATFLDANGVYWPDRVPPEDRTPPHADDHLKVTDTWVLFARPRTNNLFIHDLENLKKSIEAGKDPKALPRAVAAIVTEPETESQIVELPSFRGVSASYHVDGSGNPGSRSGGCDLYFPKPFNEEQVRIVQLLTVSDGVVVQGPPGTGKTHTIANVICHYLAEGKRVLVTSMKEPALGVLQEQLPEEIRPLAISLLTSEQEGMKQFEHAIHKIASEVQALDRTATAREIKRLQETIDALHARRMLVDRNLGEWARKNLTRIVVDGEEIAPQDAAREVVDQAGQFEWIPDALGVTEEFSPRFSDTDVVALRQARRTLGPDLDYLDASLPQLVEFPDANILLQAHQDLSRFEVLKKEIESGDIPALADSSQETVAATDLLLSHIEGLRKLRDEVAQAQAPWPGKVRGRLRQQHDDLLPMLEALGEDLDRAVECRKTFIKRPVTTPPGMELDADIVEAVANLAAGRSPFGIWGLFGRSEQKRQLEAVRVINSEPANAEDWQHVSSHLALLKRLRDLALRWNTLAQEIGIAKVPGSRPEHGIAAAQAFALYRKVKETVRAEVALSEHAAHLFPSWPHVREIADSAVRLDELEQALRHHLTKSRLANAWAVKERFQKVLDEKAGRIVDDIRRFLAQTLGNPVIPDAEMQAVWSALMAELSRVLGIGSQLVIVRDVCGKIGASGAPRYAELLRQPLTSTVDNQLPDNWRKAWRLKRLNTYLESIDGHDELKSLARARHALDTDLSRAYRDIVVKRTWLKLAENASPSIRAALQAYLNAIQKIGKGTGKRAVRFRQDARNAAAQANPAVPCWIMPHYRVSESLPPQLGCFDLVVIDEASQSDLAALPALLRAQKVLVVGDDKQVSPEAVGLEEERIRSLMSRFLGTQVVTYRPQMSPDRSMYDLFKVVFAKNAVMLKEHFRCVTSIIEYSKREFYNHELRPLRLPKVSERIDPPLVDVLVEDGYRNGDVNRPEARFIIDEITALVSDPKVGRRSIGVVSLLGDKQALEIWDRLTDELGPELIERHSIACGDARTFQGKERDIMFLSMVSAPNDIGAPLSRDIFAQRFNVAASRARDRMYLVRSVEMEQLSQADRLRRSLISHFSTPFAQDETRVEELRKLCESPFEREIYDELTQRGYWVTPQVRVGQYRIDLVVEGHNDARLAIECDGDQYHGPDKWADDMARQRTLERAGWVFWRCFASTFIRRRAAVLEDLLRMVAERGIAEIGPRGAPRSVHTELRRVRITDRGGLGTALHGEETYV